MARVRIECKTCGRDFDSDEDWFCSNCETDLEKQVANLEKEKKRLEDEVDEERDQRSKAEEELADWRDRAQKAEAQLEGMGQQ